MGQRIRSIVGLVVTLDRAGRCGSGPTWRPSRSARPTPRWVQRRAASQRAKSSAWSWVITRTWVPAGTAPSASSGTGEWWTRTRASPSARQRQPLVGELARRGSRRGAGRGRGPARIRASSSPTWPTPKIATDRHHGQRLEQQGDLAAAALAAVVGARLVGEAEDELLGRVGSARRASPGPGRRPSPRGCRRRRCPTTPPPTTTILAPASRGACPRTSATVTSTPASRSLPQPLDRAQPVHVRPPPPCGPPARTAGGGPAPPGPAGRARRPGSPSTTWSGAAPRARSDRPEDRLGRGRGGEVDAGARPARTPPTACAQRLAHRRTPASAAARRPPSSRRRRRPRGRARAGRR